MIDVKEQLRAYFDEIDPPFDPAGLMREPQPRSVSHRSVGRGVLIAGVAATVVVLAVALPVLFLANPPPTAVEPSVTTIPSVATTEASVPAPTGVLGPFAHLVWSRVESETLSSARVALEGVTSGGPGLVAVGWGQPFVWSSPDGLDWSPARTDDLGEGFDVISWESGLLAVGGQPGVEVWISEDGTDWSPTPQPSAVFEESDVVWSVTEGGPGLVAVGEVVDGPAVVWTSVDALTWERVPHDPETFGTVASMYSVTPGGPGLVAVGAYNATIETVEGCSAENPEMWVECPESNAAVWTSVDGVEWSRVPHDPAVFGTPEIGSEIFDVAVGESGLVAVGGTPADGAMAWISTDGLTWIPMPSDPGLFNGDEGMNAVVNAGEGFVAVGQEADRAAAWYSADGVTWTQMNASDEAFGGPMTSAMMDVAVVGPGLVAVGWEWGESSGWTAAVWIAEPGA